MALTSEQLFMMFAARVAEILRERFGMDPAVVLRVRREEATVQGLVRGCLDGGPEWLTLQASREQLEWNGPDATADAFVRDYTAAVAAARR